jgi:hypothetical protein
MQVIATRAGLIDNVNMPGFRLQPLAQAIDFYLRRAGLAEQFHVVQTDRVGNRDRVLVNVQPNV